MGKRVAVLQAKEDVYMRGDLVFEGGREYVVQQGYRKETPGSGNKRALYVVNEVIKNHFIGMTWDVEEVLDDEFVQNTFNVIKVY